MINGTENGANLSVNGYNQPAVRLSTTRTTLRGAVFGPDEAWFW